MLIALFDIIDFLLAILGWIIIGQVILSWLFAFNVLNSNAEQNISWATGESFLRPLTIVPPRILRIGLQLDW